MNEPSRVAEWFFTRRFVVWDMDGPTRVTADGEMRVDGPLMSLFFGHLEGRRGLYFALEDGVTLVFEDGIRAPVVAEVLRRRLQLHPATKQYAWRETTDPFDLLRTAIDQYGDDVRDIANLLLTDLEHVCSVVARPADRVHELTGLVRDIGIPQGVATNNSEYVARHALEHHGLGDGRFAAVAGRPLRGALLLKPDPDVLLRVLHLMGIPSGEEGGGVFVEDSPRNVAAGLAAGIPVLGVTGGDPDKERRFLQAGAVATIASIDRLIPGPQQLDKAQEVRATGLRVGVSGFPPLIAVDPRASAPSGRHPDTLERNAGRGLPLPRPQGMRPHRF